MSELERRLRSVFASIDSLVALAARQYPEAEAYSRDLRHRIEALGLASSCIRPRSGSGKASLRQLIDLLLAPYRSEASPAVQTEGDDLSIGPDAAGALAIAVHELATDALSRGTLGLSGTSVRVTTRVGSGAEPSLILQWTERAATGSSLLQSSTGLDRIERIVIDILDGELLRMWNPDGLHLSIRVPLKRLTI